MNTHSRLTYSVQHTAAAPLQSGSSKDDTGGEGGVLPYISHIGMCLPKELGFCGVLV